METRIIDDYKRLRREPQGDCSTLYPAKICLQIAKGNETARNHPLQYDGDSYETKDGFTVTVRCEPDDLSFDDLFGDTYGEIIETDSSEYRHGPDGYRLDDRRVYIPSKHNTFADRVAYCRKAGMARNVADMAALDGLRREAETVNSILEDRHGNCGYQAYVVVTVERDGAEYGEDSMGGSWFNDSYALAHMLALDHCLDKHALEDARRQLGTENAIAAHEMERARPDMYGICI